MFTEAFGPAPLMARLLELRARADYGLGRFSMSVAALESEVGDTAEFLERCRRIVVAAEAGGADEQDPPADY